MIDSLKKIIKYPRLTQDYPQKKLDNRLFTGRPLIHHEICSGCGECVGRCPSKAMETIPGSGKPVIQYADCITCALCEEICPTGAIKMSREYEYAGRDRKLLNSGTLVVEEGSLPRMTDGQIEKQLEKKIRKLFGRSLQIREVDAGSCNGCDYEINALNNPFNDIERLGIHFVASPRHADMLLVTGTASRNMELALLKTYQATPDPKLVVAVGACACSGGIFKDCYATRNGIDTVVPVDVYIPGCPPRPQTILYGILKALDRVK